jgi:transcription antitermination factor NusG
VESNSEKLQWFVWSVKTGKFDTVKKYIEESVPEVKQVLYPTVTKERVLKSGEAKKSKVPLYSGYMFLQYAHDEKNPKVWLKLNKHPFISTYVGPCTPADLVSVNSLQKLEVVNNEAVKKFHVGDAVRVNGGVFSGNTGTVIDISSNTVRVDMNVSNKTMKFVFSPEDLDVIDRRTL